LLLIDEREGRAIAPRGLARLHASDFRIALEVISSVLRR